MKKLTLQQVQKKYKGKYIEVSKCPFWDTNENGDALYGVRKAYKDIHENTTRAEDLGTPHEYRR
jgi:hypothetical protein